MKIHRKVLGDYGPMDSSGSCGVWSHIQVVETGTPLPTDRHYLPGVPYSCSPLVSEPARADICLTTFRPHCVLCGRSGRQA